MLISALCDYYDVLARKGLVTPDGYETVEIRYLAALNPDGTLAGIIDYQTTEITYGKNGKPKEKRVPRKVIMPKRTEKSAIDANIPEHRPLYIFGLSPENDSLTPQNSKAEKSHKAFVEKQLHFLDGLDSPLIDAYRQFALNWRPEKERENPMLLELGKAYGTAYFAFCLVGAPDHLLHDDPVFKEAWEREWHKRESDESDPFCAQCCITGDMEPIARIHNKIMKFPGGNATGSALVGFNAESAESYCKVQSYNSNISKTAMLKYTTAMNALVQDKTKYTRIHDMTVLHWAVSEDDLYDHIVDAGVFSGFTDEGGVDADDTGEALKSIWTRARGVVLRGESLSFIDEIDPSVSFYMVGIKPNTSRLAVKFMYHDRFGEVLKNIIMHQADMAMSEDARPISLWHIEKELHIPASSENSRTADPPLISGLFDSIMKGYPYPPGLLAAVIRRIKSDSDGDDNKFIKLNQTRAGIIKACLNRKARLQGKQEEIKMALDTTNTNPAYLCGRLFAVLEKLQIEASGSTLNRTIKDAYFASACCTPSAIFPRLIKLAQYHIPKAKNGRFWNNMIGEITALMDGSFPRTLTLENQGRFVLGYYHQFYERNSNHSDNSEEK